MKKPSPFHEAKPQTAKAEVRNRERKVMDAMADLLELDDELTFQRLLAERFGIEPGNSKYDKAMTIWNEIRRARF